MKTRRQLTDKQQNFILNYIKNGCNGYKAMIDAGYTHDAARCKVNTMLDHPLIRERINGAFKKVESRRELAIFMTLHEKIGVLTRIIDDVIPRDGSEPKRDYYKDALKALQELNKMQGDYAPDKRLNVTVDATKDRLKEAKRIYEEY